MGIENIEHLKPDATVDNNVPDESQAAEPVPAGADNVPDSGLPTEGDSEDDATEDAVTTHEEDDDPLSNVGDPVE